MTTSVESETHRLAPRNSHPKLRANTPYLHIDALARLLCWQFRRNTSTLTRDATSMGLNQRQYPTKTASPIGLAVSWKFSLSGWLTDSWCCSSACSYTGGSRPVFHSNSDPGNPDDQKRRQSCRRNARSSRSNGSRSSAMNTTENRRQKRFSWASLPVTLWKTSSQ